MRTDRLAFALSMFLVAAACMRPCVAAPHDVVVNGAVLDAQQIGALTQRFGMAPAPGIWWYDARSGAFGPQDGPMAGVLLPGSISGIGSRRMRPVAATVATVGFSSTDARFTRRTLVALQSLLGQVIPVAMGRRGRQFRRRGRTATGNLRAIAQARMPSATCARPRPRPAAATTPASSAGAGSGSNSFSDGATGCIVMTARSAADPGARC